MTLPDIEWLHLAVRWFHLIAGIAWIGSSFYFVWQDDSLTAAPDDPDADRLGGHVWMVHGGGFYHVRKYKVAPSRLPDHLHWFKWEAYATWASGTALITLVYWLGASSYLLPAGSPLAPWQGVGIGVASLVGSWVVYDLLCRSPLARRENWLSGIVVVLLTILAWALSQVFTGRAMFLHVGAAMATIMVANVAMVIIPNQRRMVAALLKGETPDPVWGQRGKQRSVHNTYFTLPVLFMMISNHYPITYSSHWNWLILLAIAVIGAGVRRIFVLRHSGSAKGWMLPAAAVAFALLAILATPTRAPQPAAADTGAEGFPAAPFPIVQAIITARCTACHADHPTMPGFEEPPQGVVLQTPEQIVERAELIEKMAVTTDAMPLGNATGMSQEERAILGRWIGAGAKR
ncbi:urate hydroxylase PuuD [Telmatospirillum sp.]|uniref:urate hydroxylase PuuD n=1 Tax=Telmatospirillum sp. TaxID=2079197 RepID=UPI00284335A1|nr:urate hydroxylase PuuD [Telmatospirillum sp.]MDR3437306.1 urate hydroxylase PuuD [Telmatospirillum sp.]